MEETEKPFSCNIIGCGQTFTNLDHQIIHIKKHDMVLNLGIGKTNTFVADQTPTPTRFIRTCDEVGLFEEIEMINPFEQTFKRAVESKKSEADPQNSILTNLNDHCSSELHTPHVFQHYNLPTDSESNNIDNNNDDNRNENETTLNTKIYLPKNLPLKLKLNKKLNETNDSDIKVSDDLPAEIMETNIKETHVEILEMETNNRIATKRESTNCTNEINTKIRKITTDVETKPIKILPKFNPIPIQNYILKYPTATINTNIDKVVPITNQIITIKSKENEIKQKLKAVILKSNINTTTTTLPLSTLTTTTITATTMTTTGTNTLINNNLLQNNRLQDSKIIEKKMNKKIKTEAININDNNDEIGGTPKKCTERNRAAARRYRNKMKEQHTDLVRKYSELENENKLLHEEVNQLRTILLAHTECSVTKTMSAIGAINLATLEDQQQHQSKMIINCSGKLQPAEKPTSCQNKMNPIYLVLSNNNNNNNNSNNNNNETITSILGTP